jgi:hypothetical protein
VTCLDLTECSMLKEMMQDIGFTQVDLCLPVKENSFPKMFDECLEHLAEPDFNTPKTLIIAGVKPLE